MKRLISVIVFILIGTVLAEGEEMKFVTVLSSPVGTFAHLETANPTRAVQSPVVNFGTSRVTVGRMELKGAAGYIEDLYLQSGTELGGNAGAYRVEQGMEVGSGGRITGGRLMANEVDFSGALEGKSEVKGSLYIDEIAVAGAKAGSLTIPEEVELTASSVAGESEELEWSNEYTCDYDSIAETPKDIQVTDCEYSDDLKDTCDQDFFKSYPYLTQIKDFPDQSFSCVDVYIYYTQKNPAKITSPYLWGSNSESLWYYKTQINNYEFSKPSESRDYKELQEVSSNYKRYNHNSPKCPGLGVSTNRGYTANDPLSRNWQNTVDKRFKQELVSAEEVKKYKYTATRRTITFRCEGPFAKACTPNITTCATNGTTVRREGNRDVSFGTYFFPVFSWTYQFSCQKIQYTPRGSTTPESECKEGSPKYESYLLKSKSTTRSSNFDKE